MSKQHAPQPAFGSDGSDPPPGFLVVGIGASAGGLDALKKLIDAVPDECGMAFILIQHLDPQYASMMADLLSGHTSMTVLQATEGMMVRPDHLYLIPPGRYLAVAGGRLLLSQPAARHGARFPFDFMLKSLAAEAGRRAVGVVLSGTGADGALGLKEIAAQGGLVIAQDPSEAEYDGMPRSAMLTGVVDLVLPLAAIPAALMARSAALNGGRAAPRPAIADVAADSLPAILDLLHEKAAHDFRLYKSGTLRRRIERRMAVAGLAATEFDPYLALLKDNPTELAALADDLLINVTEFFRDSLVFAYLSADIIPGLIRAKAPGEAVRVWIAGCSTGEESYSLAIICLEAIAATRPDLKLQVFATDVDATAVAAARDGVFPPTIEAEVSPGRLERFFTREDAGWRVRPELRSTIVFTVHNLLTDPPFSWLDLVSCRNLLIYLQPEAQNDAIARFDFALRDGGLLLLGKAETAGPGGDRFEIVSKSERLYRRVAGRRQANFGVLARAGVSTRLPKPGTTGPPQTRQAGLAELCRKLVLEHHAPASVLVNHRLECLYFLGPTERYLAIAKGNPSHDLLALTQPAARMQLRAALQQSIRDDVATQVRARRLDERGEALPFAIAVEPVHHDGENLLLVCFIDQPAPALPQPSQKDDADDPRIAVLEEEILATRTELRLAVRGLEIATQEQTAIHEEALSVNEEYQSTNEELLASKEELQSLNEELTALNAQLQETLDRQRVASTDLQNILYSTDIATLFLDQRLEIRFFTPATRAIFNVIPSDIGRPLADLHALSNDAELLADAGQTLKHLAPLTREVQVQSGAWYLRRVMPYRTLDQGVAGVVITFNDITERKLAADALQEAKRDAELANLAKSRFLAAASHDLRQPLQTLALIQGLLVRRVKGEAAEALVALLDPTLNAMSGMLNTLLDINQIDSGVIRPEISRFSIGAMLERLGKEFTYLAQAHGLTLRVVGSSVSICSDPRLLEQILRNLLSNAMKYTQRGKILLGCRRLPGMLSIEVWDSGVGIPDNEIEPIFNEYHQLDNAARERSRGLGLGLPIVRRLADLLGHTVRVRSEIGKGSGFAIRVALPLPDPARPASRAEQDSPSSQAEAHRAGLILIVEDDPDLRHVLELLLANDGHRTAVAGHGAAAMALLERDGLRPDIILADFNLPGGENGARVTLGLRKLLRGDVPAIILTGDISTETLREVAAMDCVHLNKPVRPAELTRIIQGLLPPAARLASPPPRPAPAGPVIYIIDDDAPVRDGLRRVLEAEGMIVEDFGSCEDFLAAYHPGAQGCLLLDAYLPGMSGMQLLEKLAEHPDPLAVIMITGKSDVKTAVQAMRDGASDFIEKPVASETLLASVRHALAQSRHSGETAAREKDAFDHLAALTSRQRQVLDLVLAGAPSKNIATDLGISQRTVENHRASIMRRTGCRSLPELARLAIAATRHEKPQFAD